MNWSLFQERLTQAHRILISAHTKIDGDGLGSEFALYHALKYLGYDVTVLNPDPLPASFQFIGSDFTLARHVTPEFMATELSQYDTLIAVDVSSENQLRGVFPITQAPHLQTLVIDHHAVGEQPSPFMFTDATAPAAGTLVMELLQFLNVPLDYRAPEATLSIAEYLFFAIATDTGWFRFPSVKPETFQQAAELTRMGVVPARLYVFAYESYSPARIKLLGIVASNVQYLHDGRVAYSWIRYSDFQQLDAPYSETTDLVNSMLMTAGVQVVALFCEMADSVRMNFRSRSDFNVAELARSLGGGGHIKAAGATLPGTLEEVRPHVLDEIGKRA